MQRIGLILISVFLLVFTSRTGKALTDSTSISLGYPIYSQYLQNGLIINPAYAGTRGSLTGSLSYRSQWMGTQGAPVTQTLSVHSPLKDDRVGLGFIAQFMQYGFTRTAAIYGNYAYNIDVQSGKVSFGLKAGIDIASTVYPDHNFLTNPGDPVFVNDKPYLLPNFGAGVYYYNDILFGGLSLPSLLSYRKTGDGSVHPYHSFRQYDVILTGGGLLYLSELFKLKPSFLLNYSMQNTKKLTQFDLNANLIIADLVWVGASWRTSEQVLVGIVQVQPTPQLMIGFSYDYPAGRMHSYSKGSTEFVIRYEFGSKISAANPRYF